MYNKDLFVKNIQTFSLHIIKRFLEFSKERYKHKLPLGNFNDRFKSIYTKSY